MSMQQSSDNAIPSILMTNANDENQSIRVESIILDADNHNWSAGNFGKSRFVIPKKASVLSNDGVLVWKTQWDNYAIGVDNSYTYARDGGGYSALKKCSLYLDGKLLSETDEVGSRMWYKNKFMPYDAQNEILSVHNNGNINYGVLADGTLAFSDDKKMGTAGCREVINNRINNLECSVELNKLFPMLQDTLLPTSLRGELIVEIEWEGQVGNVLVQGGAAFTTNTAGYEIIQPRLILDYIQYQPEVESALKDQINSNTGMVVPYREAHLIRSVLPQNAEGLNVVQQNDIELGFQNRSVMKIYVQKLDTGNPSVFQHNLRSDGQLQEEVQLVVNNKTMYDRNVSKHSEMYSYLNQTGESPFNSLPSTMEKVGASPNADYNMWGDGNGLPSNTTDPTPNTSRNGVQSNYQGRCRLLGFNLAQSRNGADTPSNAVAVGEAPIILRINRNNSSGNADEANAPQRAGAGTERCLATNVNVWVEAVRMMVIKNGRVEILNT